MEIGRNPVSKHQIQPEYGDEQADAGRDCRTRITRPNSQARTGTRNIYFPCSADREQDWQSYPVDPSLAICDDHIYIHAYIMVIARCSNQQGSKSLQNPCHVEPPDNIEKLSASRRCLWTMSLGVNCRVYWRCCRYFRII